MAKAIPTLNVIARAPFELYYEGPAEILSATNKIGPFDVLPQHADFFSVLKPCTVTIDIPDKDPVVFEITNGIITVRNDEVMLFCNM
jgi:F-type H+-transporting ATPase subunit epsilon